METNEKLINIINITSKKLNLSNEDIQSKIDFMVSLGYTKSKIIKKEKNS